MISGRNISLAMYCQSKFCNITFDWIMYMVQTAKYSIMVSIAYTNTRACPFWLLYIVMTLFVVYIFANIYNIHMSDRTSLLMYFHTLSIFPNSTASCNTAYSQDVGWVHLSCKAFLLHPQQTSPDFIKKRLVLCTILRFKFLSIGLEPIDTDTSEHFLTPFSVWYLQLPGSFTYKTI